uniref:Uncharacterized protein n=1 Tax=Rhodocyclus tenuis TaxID=1066 RepID=A0A840GB96_RHOTE|nr:hypothetical protein [Rhodocyclus tenuis]MBB4249116.1 hypothetical protein [Rhodocyclus tenuis]
MPARGGIGEIGAEQLQDAVGRIGGSSDDPGLVCRQKARAVIIPRAAQRMAQRMREGDQPPHAHCLLRAFAGLDMADGHACQRTRMDDEAAREI